MVNAPAPQGHGYAARAATGAPRTPPYRGENDAWDPPTHTVSASGRGGDAGRGGRSGRGAPSWSPPARQRGLPGWLAVIVLIVIAGCGGLIDVLRGSAVKGAFNIALVVASVVAILIVRRRSMFPVVVAPPLVYFIASAGMLYFRSNGLHDRSRVLDSAINWLVYGFPAIAGATAAVLIIGGIRMIIRR